MDLGFETLLETGGPHLPHGQHHTTHSPMHTPKPKCGGDKEMHGAYDLPLHVAGLFLVLAASLLGAGFPVISKKVSWMRIPARIFFACKHFGTGVLIATAFVHLLPTAFGSLTDPCLPDFFIKTYAPFPGVVIMASLFILFVIEMWLNQKTGGHSHGGPTGAGIIEGVRPGARPESRTSSRAVSIFAGSPMIITPPERTKSPGPEFKDSNPLKTSYTVSVNGKDLSDDEDRRSQASMWDTNGKAEKGLADEEFDEAHYKKLAANITLLEGGILFHSIFVGMTNSITVDGYVILLVALIFHQMFEGLGLGTRIAEVPYPQRSARPWLLVVAFGLTAPVGQAIGLGARNTYDPNSATGLIVVGMFNAISSGLLIYGALVDLLAEDFLSEDAMHYMSSKKKAAAFFWVLAGAIGMSVIGAFA